MSADVISMTDKKELDIQKILDMNNRLTLILGYSMGFIFQFEDYIDSKDKPKYDWLIKAIENVVYLDKPLPPAP